jgi:hypothetical protein
MDQISSHPLYKMHNIDSAINSLWNFYLKKFIPLFSMAFVMGLILQYISSLIKIDMTDYQTLDIDQMMLSLRQYIWPMLIVSLTGLLFTTILQYYVIYNPLDPENSILTCTIKSLRYYLPYLIIMVFLSIAASFAIFLGLLLFIVGVLFAAIYIMTIYLFILPVMMVEGPHIGNTISRTVILSHRNFWSNIGWTAIFIILILVISTILSGFILLPFTGSFLSAIKNPEDATSLIEITQKPLYIILSAILNGITFPLLPIFAALLYFNGRARENGRLAYDIDGENNEDKIKIEDLYARPREEDEKE